LEKTQLEQIYLQEDSDRFTRLQIDKIREHKWKFGEGKYFTKNFMLLQKAGMRVLPRPPRSTPIQDMNTNTD
jgi:hypothetical protein